MATGGVRETGKLSDETFDLLCSLCEHKNKNTEAAKFCVDCQDYYCSTCVKFHDDVPALSRHNILDKGQFQPGTSQALQMVPTERCDRHSHKHIDMYCQNHDEVGCSTCMAVDHKLCQDTFFIPDFLRNNSEPLAVKAIHQKLETTANLLADQHANFKQEKKRLLKSKDISLEKVKEFRKDIEQRLDILEQNSIKSVEAKYKAKLDKLDEEMDRIQITKDKVSSAKDNLGPTGNNVSQLFVSTKKGKYVADNAVKYIDKIKGEIKGEDIKFITDPKLMSMLKELNLLGHLDEFYTRKRFKDEHNYDGRGETSHQRTPRSSKNPVVSATLNISIALMKVKEKKHYNIRIPSDQRKCNIFSACILDDATLILADYNNNKLKRVDNSTYTVTDYCVISGNLYQVCKIGNREIAVCCGENKCIQFVSVGSKMVPTTQIKTHHRCDGLAYAAGHLYIADTKSVYIYSLSGSKVQQFNKDQSEQELFSCIYALAVSNDGFDIYVADSRNGLIALDRNGMVLRNFNDLELKRAEDVCITDNGSVLVCGHDSKNVLQFIPACDKIGEILKCDAECKAVCYDPGQSKVIVGCELKDSIDIFHVI